MIELYTWKTSNGRKASIMLEELGLPYNVHPINIGQDDQFTPEYIAINPNSKIPALVDPDGPGGKPYTLFESGAMLMYLAEKTGKLMPQEMGARYQVIQWLMFQMGGLGPMQGQAGWWNRQEENTPKAI
ncbi:glutathione S-transferase family protein [Thalassobaculum sp.]|uniref:glutathione S-transferase family protein n=1 Tax=Thalassobaculum sp. TaxID=2022740 RepID=UPI0032EC8911